MEILLYMCFTIQMELLSALMLVYQRILYKSKLGFDSNINIEITWNISDELWINRISYAPRKSLTFSL